MSCDRFSPSSLIRSIGSVRALAGSAFASALAGSSVAGFVASFDAGLLGGGSWARSARGSREPERAINNNFLKRRGMDAGLQSWMEKRALRSEKLDVGRMQGRERRAVTLSRSDHHTCRVSRNHQSVRETGRKLRKPGHRAICRIVLRVE